MRALLHLALMLGALVAPASAAAAIVPIDVAPVAPANGGVYGTSSNIDLPVSARWTPSPSNSGPLFMEITNQNITGQDGTLADDAAYRVALAPLVRGDADPSLWIGAARTLLQRTPGTYFFQLFAFGANEQCGPARGNCTLASPVFSFTIAAPPPPPAPTSPAAPFVWAAADAKAVVKRIIKQETRRTPFNLRRTCIRLSSRSFRCRSDWRDTRTIWTGSFSLSIDRTTFDVTYSFRGRRAARSCVRTKTLKRCQRRVSF